MRRFSLFSLRSPFFLLREFVLDILSGRLDGGEKVEVKQPPKKSELKVASGKKRAATAATPSSDVVAPPPWVLHVKA